jgi:hypothetical protein
MTPKRMAKAMEIADRLLLELQKRNKRVRYSLDLTGDIPVLTLSCPKIPLRGRGLK